MNETTLDKLYAPITKKERQGPGGKMYEYTPSQDVINRMNKTFKGNWSTYVAHQEIFEDQVLIRVTVSACDPDDKSGHSYSHDGFGSSLIARYSYGDNQGKMMDIGNIFKSAEAKAIVNACKRFGISLLDEEQGSPTSSSKSTPPEVTIPEGFVVHEAGPAPNPELFEKSTSITGTLDMRKVEDMRAIMDSVPMTSAPEKIEPKIPEMPSMPKPESIEPTPPVESTTAVPSSPPTFTAPDSMPPAPSTPLAGHLEPNKPGTVSDVQMAALTGFVELKGFNYQELSQNAFMQAGLPIDAIPKPKDLSYNQAVIIIKHGNEKQRQNM